MIQNHPMIRQLGTHDPQLGQLMGDPELFREAMAAAMNPGRMAQLQQSQERIVSQLEHTPEGYQELVRLFAPMLAATTAMMKEEENPPEERPAEKERRLRRFDAQSLGSGPVQNRAGSSPPHGVSR